MCSLVPVLGAGAFSSCGVVARGEPRCSLDRPRRRRPEPSTGFEGEVLTSALFGLSDDWRLTMPRPLQGSLSGVGPSDSCWRMLG